MEEYCECGKVIFWQEKDASVALASLSKRNRKQKFSKYFCKVGNCYHITTVSKKLKKYKHK